MQTDNNKTEVKNEYLIATFGDAMLERGFTSIPNTLIYYRKRLGLTASEFEFIIAVMSLNWKENKTIRDKDINPSGKYYTKQRQSLLAKGYLTFSTRNIYKENRFCGTGTIYNLSGLKKAIEMLIEEDRAIRNMDAPVEQKYDEPSLFGEDINKEPLQPRKLIKKEKTEEEKKEEEKQKEFLVKYNEVHKEALGFEINFKTRTTYKKYIVEHYKNRITENIDEALKTAKDNYLKLPVNKRDSLKLQDMVKMALCQKNESNNNNTNKGNQKSEEDKKYTIPSGIEKLEFLLKEIERGGSIDEAYSKIANCG